ncbi:GAF domain-containing protein [Undibacterium sp. Di24W]|uniref:GspE/PulE/PilB domain-containing protein n=1 Tax=Undibacterium sp. Di24W TaxID=3413033 RepID=UPI003BF3FCBE
MQRANTEEYELFHRLTFLKSLQDITNKIHATDNVQQIMLDLSDAIRDQFKAEHLTLYAVTESKLEIQTTVKTGLKLFKDFTLPIAGSSIAGYVALTKKLINIRNVYDANELAQYTPKLEFRSKVDSRTGYRTKQMLTGPIVNASSGEILGVLQLINTCEGDHFSAIMEDGMRLVCETLAVAFEKRLKPAPMVRSKYDHLVIDGVLSAPELALATSASRRKGLDLENILVDEFQVSLRSIGEALAKFYGFDYEAYRADRSIPLLTKTFQRSFVERHEWIVIESSDKRIQVLCTDPEELIEHNIVSNFFPDTSTRYFVTTRRDFHQTVSDFYQEYDNGLSNESNYGEDFSLGVATVAERQLLKRVNKTVNDAFHSKAVDIHLKQYYVPEKTATILRRNGTVKKISGQVIIDFHINHPDQHES